MINPCMWKTRIGSAGRVILKDYSKSDLKKALNHFDLREEEIKDPKGFKEKRRQKFYSKFMTVYKDFQPALLEIGEDLKERGHEYTIVLKDEHISKWGRRIEPKITFTVFRRDKQYKKRDETSLSFSASFKDDTYSAGEWDYA